MRLTVIAIYGIMSSDRRKRTGCPAFKSGLMACLEPNKDIDEMKCLNLYCGIGGNRELWTDCEVTSVEYDPCISGCMRNGSLRT